MFTIVDESLKCRVSEETKRWNSGSITDNNNNSSNNVRLEANTDGRVAEALPSHHSHDSADWIENIDRKRNQKIIQRLRAALTAQARSKCHSMQPVNFKKPNSGYTRVRKKIQNFQRKPPRGVTSECLFGIATAFAQDFVTWTLFRVGVGFTVPAILGTPYVLAIELVGPKHRTVCTILTNIAYSLGLVALAAVVYLIRDWRQLALATSVPFLSFFLYWWVLPESPRWLLARGRFEEAEKILKKMARVNGKSLPANYMVQLKRKYQVDRYMQQKDQEKDHIRSYGVMDLLRTSNLRRKTLIITFIWFTNTSVYVGLSYYAPALGGDEFLNFFLAGAVELPTYVVLWPAMDCAGRRWTLCVSMVIGGLACLGTIMAQNSTTWTLVLYCVGKMGISSSYVVLPLMASELYPTVVRGLGMSFSGVAGMLGPVFIPLVNYMGADMLVLPLLVMGALLVTGGMFSLLLPETLHQHLPQTLEDGEAFGKDWFSCCPTSYRVSDVSKNEKLPVQIVPESPIKSLLTAVTRETPLSTPVVTDGTSSTDVTSDTVLSVGREQTVRVTVV
ncbi:hypothetical protein J6590_006608 [Homalodisca vitripennis]|nr:hypothetical protein J6590_006608 [Homalodisca vitripennis]